jgi:serine/threonine protein kinase
LPGFDCSLDDLNGTLTRVASDISYWLDMLSSGPPEIPASALHFDIKTGLIGEGAFGKVYKGTLNGTDVAIKIPNYQLEESSASELEDVRQEIRVLRKIFHPNVNLMVAACFPVADHQILTNRGFMFLENVLQIVKRDVHDGRVIDWCGLRVANYDPTTMQLVYDEPLDLIVKHDSDMVEFVARDKSDGPAMSVVATANHAMYAGVERVCAGGGGKRYRHASGVDVYRKVSAGELSDQWASGELSSMSFVTAVPNGVGGKARVGAALAESLGVSTVHSARLLEAYGCWLAMTIGGGDAGAGAFALAERAASIGVSVAELEEFFGRRCEGAPFGAFVWQLSAGEIGAVAVGIEAASQGARSVVVRDSEWRAMLERMLIHGGFHVQFCATVDRRWRVEFEPATPGESGVAVVPRRRAGAAEPVWCFSMPTRDSSNGSGGFVLTRRVAADRQSACRPTLQGNCTNPGSIRIVFELMKASVKALICEPKYKYNKTFDTPKKLKLIKDVAKGIAWLHSPSVKIVHRDLKLDNLMVDFNDNGKVCDFGLGVFKKAGKETIRDTIKGNLLYRAPELMKHSRGQAREVEFTEMIDVYGFGILIWEIYRGEEWYPPHPFDEPSSYCDFVCDGKRPLLDNANGVTWPSLLAELVRACWAQNPSDRPSMEEVVQAVTGVEYQQWKATIAQQVSSDVGRSFWLDNFSDAKITWVAMRAAVTRATRQPAAAGAAPAAGAARSTASTSASTSTTTTAATTTAAATTSTAATSSAVGATTQQQQARFAALRRLLCCDYTLERLKQTPSDVLTIETFNVVQSAFGPFFVADRAGAVLAQIEAIEQEPWFHGYISRQTAEERLKVTHRELGTFLVRVSITQTDVPFVISYVGATKTGGAAIHHLKISRPRWGEPTLVMDGANYASLHQCVAKGRERQILLEACDTSVPLNPYNESM